VLDKAEYSAFESTLNSLSHRIVGLSYRKLRMSRQRDRITRIEAKNKPCCSVKDCLECLRCHCSLLLRYWPEWRCSSQISKERKLALQ